MSGEATDGIARDLAITNKRGLHARASAKFVQTVEKFDAEIEVSKDNQTVGGLSIMGLMMLAASIGICGFEHGVRQLIAVGLKGHPDGEG